MKKFLLIIMSLTTIFMFNGCSSTNNYLLKGCYQSETTSEGYVVVMSVNPDDTTFVQYIQQREVNRGTYDGNEDKIYTLDGDNMSMSITLGKDNSFDITIKTINDGKPITMKNINDVPTYYSTVFDDIDNYKKLLD